MGIFYSRLDRNGIQGAETKKRLPAHSVKPPVMMDLMTLEDEYDVILKQIEDLKQTAERSEKHSIGN